MKLKLFRVRLMFFDYRNNVICDWEDDLKGLDPADVTHTGLLKARIAFSRRLGHSTRMDVCVREIDPYRKQPVGLADDDLDIAV